MDRLFLGYAEHQQDLEDAIQILVEATLNGESNVAIQFETEVSDTDLAWVRAEVERRLRIYD